MAGVINDFLNVIRKLCDNLDRNSGIEGVLVLNADAEVLFEKRWAEDYPRDIYSNTKSFIGAAVGIAIYKELIRLTDRPIDYFNDNRVFLEMEKYWERLQLQNLLTMQSGFSKPHLMYFDRRRGIGSNNYVDYMMNQDFGNVPGTHYLYSSGDAILAGCMVEAASHSSLLAFLYDNFFVHAGMDYPIWESDMAGHYCGAAGLCLKLKDMAKLGVLYLNNGCLNGKRLFGEDWSQLSFQNHVTVHNGYMSWGYGYLWKISQDSRIYHASGVFGQDTLVIPSLNLVVAMQCNEGAKVNKIIYKVLQNFFEARQ